MKLLNYILNYKENIKDLEDYEISKKTFNVKRESLEKTIKRLKSEIEFLEDRLKIKENIIINLNKEKKLWKK